MAQATLLCVMKKGDQWLRRVLIPGGEIKTVWGSGSTGAKSLWPGTGIPRLTGVGTASRWTRPWVLTLYWLARRPWTTPASGQTRLMASFVARATSQVAVAVPRRNGRRGPTLLRPTTLSGG